jgi:eukaryotic-like serine/threonine-protein kinase
MADLTGRTVLHYRILSKLGEGGMGTVYKAEDQRLRRTVALKFLSPAVFSDPTSRSRFIREAQAAAGLDHPNICTVYGMEEAEGLSFIVMACVDGPSLAQTMAEGMALVQSLDCAIAIGEGLQCAHSHGVVHRDVKAANIIRSPQGVPRITDFGLARLENRSRLTTPGTVMGTITAMAPEQLMAEDADRRTDIWAFGVLLYEMLTGRKPFDRPSAQATMQAILHETPPSPHAVDSRLPREFKWVFEKALAKGRSERYQYIDDLVTDLRAIRRRLTPEQEAVTVCRDQQADVATVTVSPQASPEPTWGLGWPILAAIGAVLIAVVTLLVLLMR